MKEKEAPSGSPIPSLVMRLTHPRPLRQAQDKVERTQIPPVVRFTTTALIHICRSMCS